MICTRLLGNNVQTYCQAISFVGRRRILPLGSERKIISLLVLSRNLYEVQKKRALEARTKLKKKDYLDYSPCPDISNKPKPKLKCEKPPTQTSSAGGSCTRTPPSRDENKNVKLLLAALAVAGIGAGWLYFLDESSDGSKRKSGDGSGENIRKRIPVSSNDLPKKVPYLLIGGGTASFSAFRAIKSNDPQAKVLIISNEHIKPYMRPPLSKELWYASEPGEVPKDYRFKQWTGAERSLYFEPEQFFLDPTKLIDTPNGGIAVAHGYAVKKIDPKLRIATLTDGTEIEYDKCLLATGCTSKNLPVFANAPKKLQHKIMFYRTPNDFEKLKKLVDEGKSITIVGNGFLGSELSCSLANYAKDSNVKIIQVYAESGNMSKVLPEYLSKWTTRKVEQLGVCVVPGVQVKEVNPDQNGLKLNLSNGQTILTDVAVVCVGCEANTDIASVSALEIDGKIGGFVVNAELEARQDLFVAGDASCFYDPLLGRRRLEHHDHSVVSGRLAGENMVGKGNIKKPYKHQSMFWSDLGPGIGYEAVGMTEASLPTVGVFAFASDEVRTTDNLEPSLGKITEIPEKSIHDEAKVVELKTLNLSVKSSSPEETEYGKGVIFYLQDDKIVGILLWNVFNRIGLARTIINENKAYKDLNEVAKLFEIHS